MAFERQSAGIKDPCRRSILHGWILFERKSKADRLPFTPLRIKSLSYLAEVNMPKRVIDFDAMWGSDKLASCAEWAQAEYAWLYGLADASGCFELTNLRVIWGRVAAIRRNLTIERLEQIFGEFQDKGLLFVWEHEGKRYGHWTGSDVPGRLPPPSWRMRLERLAPPVPKQLFAEYVSRFARGRAALPGGGFRAAEHQLQGSSQNLDLKFQHAAQEQELDRGVLRGNAALRASKGDLEEAPAQDWNWDLNPELEKGRKGSPQGLTPDPKPQAPQQDARPGETSPEQLKSPPPLFNNINSKAKSEESQMAFSAVANLHTAQAAAAGGVPAQASFQSRESKTILVARELVVGRGPSCGPVKVRPEALDRIRARNAARDGSRSP